MKKLIICLLLAYIACTAFSFQVSWLKDLIKGEVYTPKDPGYNDIVKIDNAYFQIHPKVIVCPKNVKDIQRTIKFAKLFNARVTVRGGGHSGAGKRVF